LREVGLAAALPSHGRRHHLRELVRRDARHEVGRDRREERDFSFQLGAQQDDPASLTGDPLLFRRDGCFAYHLAVVVDDGAQGVTEVVRGADLRPVTATQIRLQEALDLPRPGYAHLGMVVAPDGSRLGKRAGALGLVALANRGIAPAEALGWLGWSLGCLEQPVPCSAASLIAAFAWSRVPKGDIQVPVTWF